MAGDTILDIQGNLTADPELRFTPAGAAVCNFTVASTPRFFDRESQTWKDGDALFLRCTAWRQMAENIAESLQRGSRVLVSGRLKQRSYETREGEKRTVIELDVDDVGASMKFASLQIHRAQRDGSRSTGGTPQDDPWGPAPPAAGSGRWNQPSGNFTDEPPF